MSHYKVKWTIDIEADGPEEAAKKALEIQRDAQSTATFFQVQETDYLFSGNISPNPIIDIDLEEI